MVQDDCICMVIGWPDIRSKGAGKFFLKLYEIGFFRDLYFKVGHAAMCLIHKETKEIKYFDFGRYTCDHGLGRARGMNTDPHLEIKVKAKINDEGKLENIQELVDFLFGITRYTHGEDVIYFSLYDKMNYAKTMKFVDSIQAKGSMSYTTFLPASTNCARFVSDAIVAGSSSTKDKAKLIFTPTFKASPVGTAIDVGYQTNIYRQKDIDSPLENFKMTRWDNIKMIWHSTKGNFSGEKVFRTDLVDAKARPANVPEKAQWLGGLGEGNWVLIDKVEINEEESAIRATSFYHDGVVNYDTIVAIKDSHSNFDIDASFDVVYDCSRLFVTVKQQGKNIRLYLIDDFESYSKQKSIKTATAWT